MPSCMRSLTALVPAAVLHMPTISTTHMQVNPKASNMRCSSSRPHKSVLARLIPVGHIALTEDHVQEGPNIFSPHKRRVTGTEEERR